MASISSTPTTVTVTVIPSWAPGPGQYATVSLSNPSSADPCPANNCVYSANNGFESIWIAWNGGAFAPTVGSYGSMLFFGGGHFAYDGNEVVAYDVAARAASRLSDPAQYNTRTSGDGDSRNTLVNTVGAYPNGTPYPNHTNMACDFLPSAGGGGPLGSYVFVGHDNTGVNITTNNLWRFDLQSRSWVRVCTLPFSGGALGGLGALAYDSKRQLLWSVFGDYHGSNRGVLYCIDVRSGTATQVSVNSAGGKLDMGYMPGFTYVPSLDCIVMPTRDSVGMPVLCIDLNGWSSGQTVSAFKINQAGTPCPSLWMGTSGADWQILANCDRLEYCPHDGNLYALDLYTSGACVLYRLMPPSSPAQLQSGTWTWARETLAPKSGESLALRSKPYGPVEDTRLYGRMRYVPTLRSFIISDHSKLPVQALRPAAFV